MKKIGVDLDDVLLDFNRGLCAFHNANFDTNYSVNDVKTYDLEITWGCTKAEAIRRVRLFYDSDEHSKTPPVEGAVAAIELMAIRHQLHIVTAKPETLRRRTEEWLERYFPGMFQSLHFTNHYDGGGDLKPTTKVSVCEKLGIECFIEDSLANAQAIAESERQVLLYNAPWNQADRLHPQITRVSSWEDVRVRVQ